MLEPLEVKVQKTIDLIKADEVIGDAIQSYGEWNSSAMWAEAEAPLKLILLSFATQLRKQTLEDFRENVSSERYEWDGGDEYISSLDKNENN